MTRKPVLYALTLHRPWCWAIACAGKDVENRTWAPPAWLCAPRQLLAIHSGRQWDTAGEEAMRSLGFKPPRESDALPERIGWPAGRIVALVHVSHWTTQPHGIWKEAGKVGWVLRNVLRIEGPTMPGQRGLWRVQAPFLPAIRAAYQEARRSVDTGKASEVDSRA